MRAAAQIMAAYNHHLDYKIRSLLLNTTSIRMPSPASIKLKKCSYVDHANREDEVVRYEGALLRTYTILVEGGQWSY